MNVDDAQLLWKRDEVSKRFSVDEADLHRLVHQRSRRFARLVRFRDWLELLVGMACGLFFTVAAFDARSGSRSLTWEWLLLGLACFYVSGMFARERFIARSVEPSGSDAMRQSLQKSLDAIERQILLMRNIVWWYLLPIFVPLMIVFFRADGFERIRTFLVVLCVALFGAIAWGNRKFVEKKLVPRRDWTRQLLEEME